MNIYYNDFVDVLFFDKNAEDTRIQLEKQLKHLKLDSEQEKRQKSNFEVNKAYWLIHLFIEEYEKSISQEEIVFNTETIIAVSFNSIEEAKKVFPKEKIFVAPYLGENMAESEKAHWIFPEGTKIPYEITFNVREKNMSIKLST